MSVTKLESLPNEILIDLLEKYINGIDVVLSFINQLNSRFNALIDQCQHFHLDFTGIRKKDFHICINLLSTNLDKIKSLTLSEHDTPELVNIFLSHFPSLNIFSKLRGFHLDFDVKTIDKDRLGEALHSLSNTNLCTLSIKVTHALESDVSNFINRTIVSLPTLKQLVLDINIYAALWNFPESTLLNIEHLSIIGQGCTWNELQHISRYCPHLKYLNVRVINKSSNNIHSTVEKQINISPLARLRTLILHFIDRYTQVTWNKLIEYFNILPHLRHLEVTNSHNRFFNANDWQMVFETSLPLLTHFTLKIIAARLSQQGLDNIHSTLASFQTPFWMENKNFHIFIMMHKCFQDFIFYYQSIDTERHRFDINYNSEIEFGTAQFWTVPERSINDNRLLMNRITSLCLYDKDPLPQNQYYFDNVNCLKVDNINSSLLKWLTTYVHLSKITKLILSGFNMNSDAIRLLIALTEGISSLQINFNQLIDQQMASIRTNTNIKRLDISFDSCICLQEHIRLLADLFPLIEHLKLDTIDLKHIPFLCNCLPNLHSLTFRIVDPTFSIYNDYKQQQWDKELRKKTKLTFKRTKEWLTIWIDQIDFEEPYWQSLQLKSQKSSHGILSEGSKDVSFVQLRADALLTSDTYRKCFHNE